MKSALSTKKGDQRVERRLYSPTGGMGSYISGVLPQTLGAKRAAIGVHFDTFDNMLANAENSSDTRTV